MQENEPLGMTGGGPTRNTLSARGVISAAGFSDGAGEGSPIRPRIFLSPRARLLRSPAILAGNAEKP